MTKIYEEKVSPLKSVLRELTEKVEILIENTVENTDVLRKHYLKLQK